MIGASLIGEVRATEEEIEGVSGIVLEKEGGQIGNTFFRTSLDRDGDGR